MNSVLSFMSDLFTVMLGMHLYMRCYDFMDSRKHKR